MPKVSVIMPTYNRAWIIRQAIDSVLAQTFTDWELLIADDGSTDDTKSVVESYKNPKIRYFPGEHKRQAVARNRVLKQAGGELVAYLDSDNLWFPKFLERMIDAFPEDGVMVYSSQNLLLIEGEKIIERKVRSDSYNPAQLLKGNYIDINSVVHRRSVLDEIGNFDERLTNLEDWDLFVRISLAHPFGIAHIDEVLSEYRYLSKKTARSVTNENFSEEIERMFGWHPTDENFDLIKMKIKQSLAAKESL
jgi:glycosyltransferase involved in cell wall biosynthesis